MKPLQAIITGAAQGLGKAFAWELAAKGYHLLLIDIHAQGLAQLARSLEKNYPIQAAFMGVDLTRTESLKTIQDWLIKNESEIDMLINNAGIGYTSPFEEHSLDFYQRLLALNNTALVGMCSITLPYMQRTRPAQVINIASIAGLLALPQKDVYAASKAFVYHFTRCMQRSYYHSSIQFTVVCPGAMNSNTAMFSQNSRLSPLSRLTVQSPETVAHIALKGAWAGKKRIIPSFSSRLSLWLSRCLPTHLQWLMATKLLRKKENLACMPNNQKRLQKTVAPAFLPILQPL